MSERKAEAIGAKYLDIAALFQGTVRYGLGATMVEQEVVAVGIGRWRETIPNPPFPDLITTYDAAKSLPRPIHVLTSQNPKEPGVFVIAGYDNEGIVQSFPLEQAQALAKEINEKLALLRATARY